MTEKRVVPYGCWPSPLGARQIAEGSIGLTETHLCGDTVFWSEMRPSEGGRYVVVRRDANGTTTDLVPSGFNARTRVHEYGGAAWLPCGKTAVFANFADQRLYRVVEGTPRPLTPESDVRYADGVCDTGRRRLIAVQEDHRGESEAVNTIVAIYPHDDREPEILVGGNDFYAAPRLSPDGSRLAWLTWNHPNMPWDAAELWVAPVAEDGSPGNAVHVAGGDGESVAQPEWSPGGTLHFVCDRGNWWNLYRWHKGAVEPLLPMEAEFAVPQWVFRRNTYGFDAAGRIVCTFTRSGLGHLAVLDPATGRLDEIATPYNHFGYVSVSGNRAVFVGGAATRPAAVVLLDIKSGYTEELRRGSDICLDPAMVSSPEPIEFPTTDGLTAHGLFYAPSNGEMIGPANEKPPLVVMIHGGPTSATSGAMKLGIQYYTSRGIAVLDVNYGGSTGYGRAYRERLKGRWGIVDVDDACNGAKWLAERGSVDVARMAITGGSAGGYTTLACLAFRDTFSAGASHCGVSDCEALARETHKFESRYLDGLIGPYPERRDLYIERSPIHHVDGLSCPVIFFQGLEDKIVPPDQARLMADALRKKRLPVALIEFEGEQHGFRKAENVTAAMEGELAFFARVFGFQVADNLPPLEIENL
jgi:dipeptidyl aminopeptidase/acylaminoacyl peptidase